MKRIVMGIALMLWMNFAQAQPTPFRVMPDMQRGFASYIRAVPIYIDARVLAANVSETVTIPVTGNAANTAVFSANCAEYYVKAGASAAVPAADVTDGTASAMNPSSYWFPSTVTQFTLISPTSCTITYEWYLIN